MALREVLDEIRSNYKKAANELFTGWIPKARVRRSRV
jgi:hypothetical protein